MQNHFRIGRGLTDGAPGDQLATQGQAIGEIAVMGDRDAADFEFCKQRLHVAQSNFAGRRIARVANRHVTRQFRQRCGIGVVVAHQTHMLFSMELCSIEAHDTRCFLTTMLQGMQAEGCQCCCIGMTENTKHAAFFMQGVTIKIMECVMRNRLIHLQVLANSEKTERGR